MIQQLFELSPAEEAKLGLGKSKRNKRFDIYKDIFDAAKEKGKTVLTIAEITAGYYIFGSKKRGTKIRDKKWITTACGCLSGLSYQPRILTRVGCGKYKFYEEGDDEKYKNNKHRKKLICNNTTEAKQRNYYCGKKVVYNGKTYESMALLADSLGLHSSTVSAHYKRHNGDLSGLGRNSIQNKPKE